MLDGFEFPERIPDDLINQLLGEGFENTKINHAWNIAVSMLKEKHQKYIGPGIKYALLVGQIMIDPNFALSREAASLKHHEFCMMMVMLPNSLDCFYI